MRKVNLEELFKKYLKIHIAKTLDELRRKDREIAAFYENALISHRFLGSKILINQFRFEKDRDHYAGFVNEFYGNILLRVFPPLKNDRQLYIIFQRLSSALGSLVSEVEEISKYEKGVFRDEHLNELMAKAARAGVTADACVNLLLEYFDGGYGLDLKERRKKLRGIYNSIIIFTADLLEHIYHLEKKLMAEKLGKLLRSYEKFFSGDGFIKILDESLRELQKKKG